MSIHTRIFIAHSCDSVTLLPRFPRQLCFVLMEPNYHGEVQAGKDYGCAVSAKMIIMITVLNSENSYFFQIIYLSLYNIWPDFTVAGKAAHRKGQSLVRS